MKNVETLASRSPRPLVESGLAGLGVAWLLLPTDRVEVSDARILPHEPGWDASHPASGDRRKDGLGPPRKDDRLPRPNGRTTPGPRYPGGPRAGPHHDTPEGVGASTLASLRLTWRASVAVVEPAALPHRLPPNASPGARPSCEVRPGTGRRSRIADARLPGGPRSRRLLSHGLDSWRNSRSSLLIPAQPSSSPALRCPPVAARFADVLPR